MECYKLKAKLMKLGGLQASKACIYILHGPPTFVLKYAQDVIFIYLVVQQNVNMAEFWIQTSCYFFILETTEHFLEMGYWDAQFVMDTLYFKPI